MSTFQSLVLSNPWASVGALSISYALWRILKFAFAEENLRDVPGPPNKSWLTGHILQIFNFEGWEFHREIVAKYGSVVKLSGILGEKQLYVADPKALYYITVKDLASYDQPQFNAITNYLTMGSCLISEVGASHRRQRKVLNPVFSIKHMRGLTGLFYEITHELVDKLSKVLESGEQELNMLDWMSRAALEYISQGGIGYSFDALDKTKTNTYAEAAKRLLPTILELAFTRRFLPILVKIGSPGFRRKLVEWTPYGAMQRLMQISDVMVNTTNNIYEQKKDALAKGDDAVVHQIGQGKDIISVLMKANMEADEKDRLAEEDVVGQMNLLIFAGHDTTSHGLARALHLLATHIEVQEKLRKEVTEARAEYGDMDYDKLQALPYLDAICRETLRVYSPVSYVIRTAYKDAILPVLTPIKSSDGKKEITEIPVKKGTNIIVAIDAANRSKDIWGEDAEEWKPERWLSPLPETVASAKLPGVYSSMMTFIGGSRACIGFKFAELEMKLVLSILVEKFRFTPSDKEIFWSMAPIVEPVIKGSKDMSVGQLPIRVARV